MKDIDRKELESGTTYLFRMAEKDGAVTKGVYRVGVFNKEHEAFAIPAAGLLAVSLVSDIYVIPDDLSVVKVVQDEDGEGGVRNLLEGHWYLLHNAAGYRVACWRYKGGLWAFEDAEGRVYEVVFAETIYSLPKPGNPPVPKADEKTMPTKAVRLLANFMQYKSGAELLLQEGQANSLVTQGLAEWAPPKGTTVTEKTEKSEVKAEVKEPEPKQVDKAPANKAVLTPRGRK